MANKDEKIRLNASFNFVTQLGLILERNPKAQEFMKVANTDVDAFYKPAQVEIAPNLSRGDYTSLYSYAFQPDTSVNERFLYLVFGLDNIPTNNFADLFQTNFSGRRFCFTNKYTDIDDNAYFAVVKLNSKHEHSKAVFIDHRVDTDIQQADLEKMMTCYMTRLDTYNEQSALMVAFPRIMADNYDLMSLILDTKQELSPIIPRAVQRLVLQDSAIKRNIELTESKTFLDLFKKTMREDYVFPRFGKIAKGTTFYHYSGNATLPKGSHTNMTSFQMYVDKKGGFAQNDVDERQEVKEFLQKHPTMDSVTLSTRPPLMASAKNGVALSRYVATREFDLSSLKVYNIFLFAGNTPNDEFLIKVPELCKRISWSEGCESVALMIWTQVGKNDVLMSNIDKIDNKNVLDLITFHYVKNPRISQTHLSLFTGTSCDNIDEYPPLLWEFDLTPLYVNDLLGLAEKESK
jgi:hypothetical protein